MNFTSKSRYAIKILMDLAYHSALPHVHRQDIAQRHGIPPNYLDQIMLRLKRSGLVDSIRGRGGGYRLAKQPAEISIWDIFSAVEDSVYPVKCLEKDHGGGGTGCNLESACISHGVWSEIFEAFKQPLSRLTLSQIVSRWPRMTPEFGSEEDVFICEAGGRGVAAALQCSNCHEKSAHKSMPQSGSGLG